MLASISLPRHNKKFARFELWQHGLMAVSAENVIVWQMDAFMIALYGENLPLVTIEYSTQFECYEDGDSLTVVIASPFHGPC